MDRSTQLKKPIRYKVVFVISPNVLKYIQYSAEVPIVCQGYG